MSDDMMVSKGLALALVALPGVGICPHKGGGRKRRGVGVLFGGDQGDAAVGDGSG